MLLDDFAVQFITAVFLILLFVFGVLVTYSVIQRFLNERIQNSLLASESYIQKYIYHFLDDEINEEGFSKLLRGRHDIVAAYRLINPMIDNMKGPEQDRLRELLEIKEFKNYFLSKLMAGKPIDMAHACTYFAQKKLDDSKVAKMLQQLQHHEYSVLAYSATLALLSYHDSAIRDQAVQILLNRKKNASMAINDVIFIFYRNHENPTECGNFLMKIASSSYIPLSTASNIIRTFPELGFYDQTATILQLLRNPSRYDYNGIWTATLISTLREMGDNGVSEIIIQRQLYDSIYQQVRLACARWLVANYNSNLQKMAFKLANDSDLEIRFLVQQKLYNHFSKEELSAIVDKKYAKELQQIVNLGEYDAVAL